MIICHSRKFVFFSFPKTGSESLREMLAHLNEEEVTPYKQATPASPWYSHMSPAEAERAFAAQGRDLRSYHTFTVTRNPYARMVSIYEMVMAVDGVEKLKRRSGLKPKSFGNWLRSTSPDGAGAGGRVHQRWRKFGTWSTQAWMAGQDDQPLVQTVLRLEHLADELPPLFAQLDVPSPQTLTHKNKRVARDWRDHYDDESRALIADRYRWDIDTFGYQFAT